MIKFGKININIVIIIVRIFRFDMEVLLWFKVLIIVEFYEDKEVIGIGGFCKIFKVIFKYLEFVVIMWVIKYYLLSVLKCILDIG